MTQMVEFRLPDVGEGLTEAEIIEIDVAQGDEVVEDQTLMTVQTDKALVDLPSPATGVVERLDVEPGQMVSVGSVIVVIATDEPDLGTASVDDGTASASADPGDDGSGPPPAAESGPDRPSTEPASTRARAAPSVRRIAAREGIDLADVDGTGPGGRVTRADVTAFVDAPPSGDDEAAEAPAAPHRTPPPTQEDRVVPLRGLRREIARRMTDTWRDVPHIADFREIDATRLLAVQQRLRELHPDHASALTLLPLMVKIAATVLRDHPMLNASLDDETITLFGRRHIGVATATEDGLLVPVIRDVDDKSVLDLALEGRDLVEAARRRRLAVDQLRGGTFTVNNLGALGGTYGTPILRSPEVGIMAFGRVTERPVVRNGEIVVRHILPLTTVADHRVLDGDTLSGFTNGVTRAVEEPALLLDRLR